jgi:hypothetical protein
MSKFENFQYFKKKLSIDAILTHYTIFGVHDTQPSYTVKDEKWKVRFTLGKMAVSIMALP